MIRGLLPVVLMAFVVTGRCYAQSFEAEQLLLDVEKLSELKGILQDLKDGYNVLQSGYSAIRDVAKGSFDLHKAFLDGLLAVSPAVKGYVRVAEIADLQIQLVQRADAALVRMRQDGNWRPDEVAAVGQVYSSVLADCAEELGDVVLLLTDGALRASDAERMRELDTVYYRMLQQYSLVVALGNHGALLSLQRGQEAGEVSVLRKLFGITP